MKIFVAKNYNEMSKIASEIVIGEIMNNPKLVLGFATGKTPLEMYRLLTIAHKKRKIDFSNIKTFNLDEYYPISRKDKKSYFYYMHKNLFDKINIKKKNINLLNGEAKNVDDECRNYERKIRKTPIDVQILGVGVNGHIGFNEPGSLMNSKTRLVELKHKAAKKEGLTMGIGTIMKAKKIILLASGRRKATAIKCLVRDNPETCCPVSFLKNHKNLIIIVDREAGRCIK